MIAPGTVQTETVVSELDTRKASGTFVLIDAKRGADVCSEAALTSGVTEGKVRDAEKRRSLGNRKNGLEIDEKGFRR